MLRVLLLEDEFSLSRLDHASAYGELHSSHLYNRWFSVRCIGLLCQFQAGRPTWAPGYPLGWDRGTGYLFSGKGGIRLHSHPGLTVAGKSL
jgi:hypothetical protein